MASKDRQKFDNSVVEWVDSRLPIFTMLNKEYGVFPTPKNFNYFWNFGAIAMVMLVTMIITGITLAMHYNPSVVGAFDSVERIMRDVNGGWMIRYMHMNGASFFFIAVYIHIFRGLFYGSYKQPRELLWILGVTIFLLMMATAFMGYVLPWGQMSLWGATVITSLFSAIPFVGDSIVTLLWGGFSVDNATLVRFFALHYLMPFLIVAVVFLHVWALHVTGSNNPLGVDVKGEQDTLPFHPYYTMKDAFGILVFLIIYAAFVFFMPNALGHPDNYIPGNPLVTPPHIVPEWYFLPFYAILRAVTFDLNIYLAVAGGVSGFLVYQYCWLKSPDKKVSDNIFAILGVLLLFGMPGALLAFFGEVEALKPVINMIPLNGVSLMAAKLGGVLAMFGSIAMLFLLPFIDKHPVRSSMFRPWYKIAVLSLLAVFIILGVCGAKPAEGLWVPLAQIMTLAYFAFFLVFIPYFNNNEPIVKLPGSIHEAVMAKAKHAIIGLLALGFMMAPLSSARAAEGHTADLPNIDWSFDGPFGVYDRAALQRGFQVYKQVCAACHSMKYKAYRNLADLGYNEAQIKSIAAEYSMIDGPDDDGEMFERPGRSSDRFKSPYKNDNQAKASNNGALPPDLSLIVKARSGGANYLYGILTGYEEPPVGTELGVGQYWNKYMAGNRIAMAAPLVEGAVAYEDQTPTTVDQYARDLTQFLAWAAEPEMEVRKQTGVKVIFFLIVFAGIMYAVKRKIWAKVH